MKFHLVAAAGALAAISFASATAIAAQPVSGKDGTATGAKCEVYEGTGFKGTRINIAGGEAVAFDGSAMIGGLKAFQEKPIKGIGSVASTAECRVKIFANGAEVIFENNNDLTGTAVQSGVTGFTCTC